MTDQRSQLLTQLGSAIDTAARRGAFGQPIAINAIEAIAGPRAGAVEVNAGLDSGRLMNRLAADDFAAARQFIPWDFPHSPAVYMSGRHVRIEAGWPESLAERSIKVTDLNRKPYGSGRWLAGLNELGRVVTLGLSDHAPHFLVSGTTGSGKTVAVRSLITQLATNGDQLILIDGKYGEGLAGLSNLPGVIGPLATDLESARSALTWAAQEMQRRYETHDTAAPRLVVVIDELQEFAADPACIEIVRRLAAQGRAARVSLIVTTQHPNADAFGSDASIKRNITGRIALKVSDYKASEVAIGGNTPRADWLLGAGDAYCVVPGVVMRTQIAYLTRSEIARHLTAQPKLSHWPAFSSEQIADKPGQFSARELAYSLLSASNDEGRPTLLRRLSTHDGDRARRLHRLGRDILTELETIGVTVCLSGADPDPAAADIAA
ncbi:MAG: type IV secretion system DNA-binding domain-containing protein [Candidatus Accumulibacter sp.]|uniref:FtsK/SpoIIIE domain-containing protein n=1 Tax=Accumulibacter sp. TaxID=2053492 RepID=UPI002590C04C|nr:FtsK/SpoIIIE domain-containing protein [Accumulibacter sp.]MBK8113308.1 type IV secretion system DNA-binding domain-containing protein [Accumulibacter sp.]